MKQKLTINKLVREAKNFCELASTENHISLLGTTDGKAVGTYIEHKFQKYLSENYDFKTGNSAKGIDLPGKHIMTDIKVTSHKQPQSSCPFQDSRQKIYGLGYNLLVFVYEKQDMDDYCKLQFVNCTFIDKERTSDYTITKRLREMVKDGANKEDIISLLSDRGMPGDELTHSSLADEILSNPPKQGYLTISNALQWRLQYTRVISLGNSVLGVQNYDW